MRAWRFPIEEGLPEVHLGPPTYPFTGVESALTCSRLDHVDSSTFHVCIILS